MSRTIQLNVTTAALFAVTLLSALLAGGTFQWLLSKDMLTRGFRNTNNQYNILVAIATTTALIQTVACFINTIIAPNHIFGFSAYIAANWVFMTHSSVMMVSRKLSLMHIDAERVWRRLLLVNAAMLPLSAFICISWSTAHNSDSAIMDRINVIMEPIQIALWGLIEFCMSGMFVVKMWKFNWATVQRKGVFVLFLVLCLDTMSVLLNLFLGDLESTCVKGLVYSLRIRLEISVLDTVVDFVNSKRQGIVFSTSSRGVGASTDLGAGSVASAAARRRQSLVSSSHSRRLPKASSCSAVGDMINSSRAFSCTSIVEGGEHEDRHNLVGHVPSTILKDIEAAETSNIPLPEEESKKKQHQEEVDESTLTQENATTHTSATTATTESTSAPGPASAYTVTFNIL